MLTNVIPQSTKINRAHSTTPNGQYPSWLRITWKGISNTATNKSATVRFISSRLKFFLNSLRSTIKANNVTEFPTKASTAVEPSNTEPIKTDASEREDIAKVRCGKMSCEVLLVFWQLSVVEFISSSCTLESKLILYVPSESLSKCSISFVEVYTQLTMWAYYRSKSAELMWSEV